jgi:hypothetical protein
MRLGGMSRSTRGDFIAVWIDALATKLKSMRQIILIW